MKVQESLPLEKSNSSDELKMLLLQSLKYFAVTAFIIVSFLIYEISCSVFHGITIPDEVVGKLVEGLEPLVDVTQGTIKGSADLSRNGRVFLSFKGIPYGKVEKRFENSVPADKWDGVWIAKEFGPICSQVDILTHTYRGQEDCLTLNVYVPKSASGKTLPVMVYIYGGAFVMGESNIYQPKYLMDEDIILVTLNYRVGAFGFLNAGIKGASGNQGLKDIVLGLKWVQENIAQFGGDSSRVTIFGLSAGGAAVAHLVASPMAAGLFSGAISQSGMATVGWAQWPDEEFDEPKKLAVAMDCPTSNKEYMVECLRKIKPDVLARATDFKDSVWFERESSPVFAPSIETYKESENDSMVFQAENVETVWDKGTFNKVPFMIGFVSHEGLSLHAAPILISPNNTKKLNEKWGRILPQALFYWTTAKDPCVVSAKLRKEYFQNQAVSLETAHDLRRLYSDIGFEYPARKVAIKASQFTPVYVYNFTREVKVSYVDLFGWWRQSNPLSKPPVHGDDAQFIFNGLRLWPDIQKNSPDNEFSVNHIKFLVSFAQDNKPTHVWGSKVKNVEPVDVSKNGKLEWIQIDNELGLKEESEDFIERMHVLDEICKNDFEYCSSVNLK